MLQVLRQRRAWPLFESLCGGRGWDVRRQTERHGEVRRMDGQLERARGQVVTSRMPPAIVVTNSVPSWVAMRGTTRAAISATAPTGSVPKAVPASRPRASTAGPVAFAAWKYSAAGRPRRRWQDGKGTSLPSKARGSCGRQGANVHPPRPGCSHRSPTRAEVRTNQSAASANARRESSHEKSMPRSLVPLPQPHAGRVHRNLGLSATDPLAGTVGDGILSG